MAWETMNITLQAPCKTDRDGHFLEMDSSNRGSLPSRRPTHRILQPLTCVEGTEWAGGRYSRYLCHEVPACGENHTISTIHLSGASLLDEPWLVDLYEDPSKERMRRSQEH